MLKFFRKGNNQIYTEKAVYETEFTDFLAIISWLSAVGAVAQDKTITQTAEEQEQIRRFREIVMRPVVYKIAGMEQVKILSNIDYAKSGSRFRKMDVYLPQILPKPSGS